MTRPDDTRRPSRSLRRRALAGAAVLVVVTLGGSAAPAFAHNSVLGTTPAAGSVVTEQPGVITITTNDNLLDLSGGDTGSAMQVSGPADAPRYYGDGCATTDGPTLATEVQLGRPGEYTVVWQTVSTDGHPISDDYTFTWEPDADQALADGSATAPTCGTDDPSATAAPATDAATTDAAAAVDAADLLWIGGALVAVLAAIAATLLILRRRPTP